MLGQKIYKKPFDYEEYNKCADWCNRVGTATIEDKGDYYECVAIPAPSLEELKQAKINEFKAIRDNEEIKPIEYSGNLFDYDDKARDRINAAIIALDLAGEGASLSWTTANNTEATVTANDLRAIIAAVAVRSNELHIRYRNAKAKVEEAQTAEELEAIEL